jgi:hypothetical protein
MEDLMILPLLIRKPTIPCLRQSGWALWMLPITHRALVTLHEIPLAHVLCETADSLRVTLSLGQLRGIEHSRLEGGDVVYEPDTGRYWLLSDDRQVWRALNAPPVIDLSRPLFTDVRPYQEPYA